MARIAFIVFATRPYDLSKLTGPLHGIQCPHRTDACYVFVLHLQQCPAYLVHLIRVIFEDEWQVAVQLLFFRVLLHGFALNSAQYPCHVLILRFLQAFC